MIRTEELLTSPHGFGIATATPAQRAACRILDGQPLAELGTHPDVAALVGGAEALAQLPSERGIAPTEVLFLAAIRSAKTMIACAAAIRMTQTVDVSKLGPGEIPRVSLVSLKLDTSAVAYNILRGTIAASPVLKRLLIAEGAESLTLRHPSGRPIEIACVAGAKAGSGLVARWSAGVIFDEAPRMASAEDAVVNLTDARTAILGRLLPGAQALYIGSPWAPHGVVYALVDQHWGKPSRHMVVVRGTGPMLNPRWWTPERCAQLEQSNPTAYRTDVLGEFADPEAGLLNPGAIYRATREGPLELPYVPGLRYSAAVDPSEGGARGNGFTLAIVDRGLSDETVQLAPGHFVARHPPGLYPRFYRVVLVREWRGLTPSQCWREIAKVCHGYGITRAVTDQYAASANADLAKIHGLRLSVDKATGASKLEDWTDLATLLHSDQIELSPDPTLKRDLLSVKRRVTTSGATIVLPRTSDGRHCDTAAALCAALKHAAHEPQEIRSMGGRIPGL
jgi:hypothetical protein